MLRSFRFPSNVGGDLNFILSGLEVDDDNAISGFFIDAVNMGENFGGKGIGLVSRDKVEMISAAFLSSAACLVVGICTSSIYSSLDSFSSCSTGSSSSSSCSEDDYPIDSSQLSL